MFEDSVSSLPSIWASMNSWFTPAVFFVLLNVMIGTIAIASNLGTQKHHEQQQQQQQQPHQQHQDHHLARSPSMLQRLKSFNLNMYAYRSPDPPTTSNFEKPPETETQTLTLTHEPEQPQLTRSPSLLQRLKSINFHIPQLPTTTTLHQTHEPEEPPYYSLHHQQAPEEQEQEFEEDEDHFPGDPEAEPEADAESEPEQSIDEIYSQLNLHDSRVTRTKSDTQPASGEVPPKLPKKMKKSASSRSAFSHFQAEDIVESCRPATVRERKAKVTEADDDEVDAKADDFINRFKQQLKLQRLDSIIRYKDMINRGSGTGK